MIKKIKIDFDKFGVNIEEKFKPGVNILEKPNGYGKTILAKTIVSAYSKNFSGERSMPSGVAELHTDSDKMVYTKGMWVGAPDYDGDKTTLAKYILPGEFMKLSTPNQRKLIVDLLGIDRDKFLKESFENFKQLLSVDYDGEYSDSLKKELKDEIKEAKGKEDQLLQDIQRLQAEKNTFKEKDFSDIDNYNNYVQEVTNAWNDKMKTHREKISKRNQEIRDMENEVNKLRSEYNQLASELQGTCPTCKQSLPNIDTKAIEAKMKQNIAEGKSTAQALDLLKEEDISEPILDSLEDKAKYLGIKQVDKPTEERLLEKQEYINTLNSMKFIDSELELKKNQLKDLGEINKEKIIECIDKANSQFTSHLESKMDSLGLDIELFEPLKKGGVKETFNVFLDGKPYKELSKGNQMILDVKLAMIFIDYLELDFIVIDEAGVLGNESFKRIVESLTKNNEQLQIIALKPDRIKKSDIK